MLRVVSDHFSHSDTGRARRANEDAYYARAPVFVVADGMGGAQAGEVASRMAIEAFEKAPDGAAEVSGEELLVARVRDANARIHALSEAEQDRAGMGTTITAVHVGEHDVAVAHVGDSRAYRLRGETFERLTEDHSLVEEMRRRGQLTAQEADEHPQRSIITRALGPEPDVLVDTRSWRGAAGDVFLLCSDGLTSMVPELQIGEILRGAESLRTAGRELIDAANEAGGRDNITVVLFALEEVGGVSDDVLEQATSAGGSGALLTTAAVRAALADAPPVPARPPGPARPQAPGAASAQRRLRPSAPAPPPPDRARRRGRRFMKIFAIVALIVIPLAFGAYSANTAVYFVGTNEAGFVTLYRGLPYALPGFDLYQQTYVSSVPIATVPSARRRQLVDHTLRSHDDAADLVRELERGRVSGL
ncbi:MAG TPA: Stp1/IreP family PP2C-type Ser/Thr phosphatase [Solirubrobacteraceae bacterium]|jgi:protein phosphatase|nr:Stp1/IreP family PP2C-type Ser/Thr phosphatase [Solirubrobacteraceae bacterium]